MTPVDIILNRLNQGQSYEFETDRFHLIMLMMDEVVARRANVKFEVRKYGPRYIFTVSQ